MRTAIRTGSQWRELDFLRVDQLGWRESLAMKLRARVGVALALTALLLGSDAAAQSVPAERPRARPPSALTGWADWEKGEALFSRIKVPPAPVRSAEEELKTFKLAPGYRVELVAAEPLVQRPIFFEFDPDGRIWVVEYQGYMRDLEGRGEGDPICRVVVLEDTDADGRADKSTVFLDQLVMPRSFAFVEGGVLVAEPPRLWFCEDTDGDLRCDRKVEAGEFGIAGNPQHTANGLRRGLDNWLHSADWPKRHRWTNGKLIEEETIHRGQFGVTFDETGRFMTCHESSPLHADLIPAEYLQRNRNLLQAVRHGASSGVHVNIAKGANEVFPIRVTPAVTLGALELRDDGRLRTYTIVSGSCYYDGDQFPADARGNVFVPESGAHLIGRLKLTRGIEPRATRFYPAEEEFLASTDERFRPVNARVGPDGALYVADLYHGIIEHVIFMVPWLTKQIEERGLALGNDLGRLWRIVAEDQPLNRRAPRLSKASTPELLVHLSHANGWWRQTAQRLLVERRDPDAVPALRALALRGPNALARLHALWTLEGLEALDSATTLATLDDGDEAVRAAAIRLSERGLDPAQGAARLATLQRAAEDTSELVRLQAVLSASAMKHAGTLPLLAKLVGENEHQLFRIAILTGLQGRELDILRLLLDQPGWRESGNDHRRSLVALLAQCIMEEGDAKRAGALLELLDGETTSAWQREAILDGLAAVAPSRSRGAKPIALAHEPAALTKVARGTDAPRRQQAYGLIEMFTWPGAAPLAAAGADLAPLSAEQQRFVETGREPYILFCASCHQPHGGGAPNLAPPLAGSDWVSGPPERLMRIVLHGLYGPIEVTGKTWNLHMPGLGGTESLTDEKLAAILSYTRRGWGNTAPPVEPQLVAAVRRETAQRTLPWTAAELTAVEGAAAISSDARTPILKPLPSGEIVLHASQATTSGQQLAYRPALDILAPWRIAEDLAEWRVELPVAGSFEVFVKLAADDASAGDHFLVETEGSKTRGTVPSTGGYDRFREHACGRLTLRPGLNRILMRPDGPLREELADVRGLRLVPVH